MITIAMREALHARRLSDEEILNLTPEGAHKILQTPDSREVREFLTTIVAQAQAATKYLEKPGLLQMILVHPLNNDYDDIVVYRYALDGDSLVERMTREAVSASEAGFNVYLEGRTVRRDLKGKERGGYADTIAVFTLVVDADADKGKGWIPTVPTSLSVETSPGNAHYWLFFEQGLDANKAKAYGERLRAATNADSDTGNACQPYRVAGTVNYPNKNKLDRGRIVTWTRVLAFDPEVLWTPERFEVEFPAAPKPANGGGPSANGKESPDEANIPADTLAAIQDTSDGGRGRRFFNIMIALKERGFTIDGIVALFEKYPDGVAAKYHGRLRHQVETVWAKLDKGGENKKPPATLTDITILTKAEFLADFVPPDYLVDGVLQRRFIYSLTAVTGHGKTALALNLARVIACLDLAARFGPHAVEKGRVVSFVGENPDDVRCRIIGDDSTRNDDPGLDRIQLLPRGGGAFLNEMDGNLTLRKHDEDLATLHHSADKWRGPGFEPITFKLERIKTEKLVDSKGRQIPTVHAVVISEAEEEEQAANAERDEDQLLAALTGKKPLSIADLARACSWLLPNGEPYKSKVQRAIARLQADQLVKRVRGNKYRLTDKGRKEANGGGGDDNEGDATERTVEDRGGAVSKKPFHALRGIKQRNTVPCAFCGKTGDVYGFADGRHPKGQRHHAHLHEGCAEPFFTGQPKPEPADDHLDPDLN